MLIDRVSYRLSIIDVTDTKINKLSDTVNTQNPDDPVFEWSFSTGPGHLNAGPFESRTKKSEN
jgi:hypothetical protein